MNTEPYDIAFGIAVETAERGGPSRAPRQRWRGQNEWDRLNMVTESTQFTRSMDAELRRCCREARVNRSRLINYMLRTWMAAWAARKGKDGSNATLSGLRH